MDEHRKEGREFGMDDGALRSKARQDERVE
jgi:hypothetical protein